MSVRLKWVSLMARSFHVIQRIGLTGLVDPVISINEYPKSGGTWMAKMTAAAVDLPFIDNSLLIPGGACVIRTHWDPCKVKGPVIYVVRDCRDVMISLFHHRCKNIENTPKLKKMYIDALGAPLDVTKILTQIDPFIEFEFGNTMYGNYLNWATHTSHAIRQSKFNSNHTIVKYEDLCTIPVLAMGSAIYEVTGLRVEDTKLQHIANLFDLNIMKNSKSLTKAETTFVRTGGSGGWSDVFSDTTEEILERNAGKVMRELGYIE